LEFARTRRATRTTILVTLPAALAVSVALAACGSDDNDGQSSSSSGGSSGSSGASGGLPGADGGGDATSPPGPPRELPLGTPSLGGYTFVDAFAKSVSLTIPSAIVWPKVDGAPPFVLERTGTVVQIEGGATTRVVLDISSSVALFSEGGALGMALHPMFGDGSGPSPYAYVWYNASAAPRNKQRLARFTWNAASRTFDPASQSILVEVEETRPEHNAGRVQFGPDGFLYFGNGDDIDGANHQRIDRSLFAGIFRIDVDSRGGAVSHAPPRQPTGGFSAGYFIPNDNPFVGTAGALEEFYALGFRNPFGFSFDRSGGAMWVSDVGDSWREEIDRVVPGGNYEWPYREGDVVHESVVPTIGTARAPEYSYTHAEMGDLSAVLGGFVYRGKELPELDGKYIYSDWPSNRLWAFDPATKARTTLVASQWKLMPMALGEDNHGEIYLLHSDGIVKLARDNSADAVPKRLTETTLFADVAALTPAAALVPYDIISPLWSDGAVKQRWIRLPQGARVDLAEDGALKFPTGTILVKHFELPPTVKPQGRTRRLETRVLVVGTDTTYGLTYRWNAAGTDADLVPEGSDEPILDETSGQTRTWHVPSFGQCWSCHRAENRVLGVTARQLVNVEDLAARGVLDPSAIATWPERLAKPSDTAASIEARATAYLAANCSGCHHDGASFLGGGDTWNASPGVPLAERGLVGMPHHNYPMAKKLGLPNAPLVAAGDPAGSLLLARLKTTDPDLRMPPLGRNIVDPEGALVVEQWIQSMNP
jgi:uncharacterized repeat protein (TIGR03806 family)